MSIVQELIQKGLLSREQASSLEFELRSSKKSEEELILEKGLASEDLVFSAKAEMLKIPFKTVSPEDVPLETLELIPEETAKFYKMIPLVKNEKDLAVGMVYPENLKAQEALKFLARQQNFVFRVFLITPSNLNSLLRQYRNLKKEVGQALEELKEEIKTEDIPKTAAEFERLVEEAPISKIVAVILRHAVEGLASDIHIEPGRDKLRIRFRLTGFLHSSILLPIKVHPAIIARIKILSNLRIDETRVPQDGRFSTKVDGRSIDFRVSIFPTTLGEKAAIRVLDPTVGLKKFEDLGLTGQNLKAVKEQINRPYGLILSTGPTGSGKTTTLYAILQLLNKEEVNIVTLEDPVEYYMEGINQSQVRPEIGYDFASGLRNILRQDPNIIMVGEIRDEETASLATHAALTGHIVLSTLHTNNALGVVPRLIDLGIKPYLIPSALSLAIGQRLVRKLCPDCKKAVKPKATIENMIKKELFGLPLPKVIQVFQPVGCKNCSGSGFVGRLGVFEVLAMTESLSEIILKEPSEAKILQEAKKQGMITMKQDGILKALEGITTIEEVLRVAEEK